MRKVAHQAGYFVDPNFGGHGIARFLHMAPFIDHVPNSESQVMEEGMVFTIEPILTMFEATDSDYLTWEDKWTIQLKNNPSAQEEHMVLIKQSGVEILTVL
jgi:methionyl aminopeptidase